MNKYLPPIPRSYANSGGYTTACNFDPTDKTHWKEDGRVLARCDNWNSGTPTQTLRAVVPWGTTTSPQSTTANIAQAGDYGFAAELYMAKIDIYDARTGAFVSAMTPGTSVNSTSGWVDVYMGISAIRRSNGEYVVLVEDDVRAKLLIYRWTP